MTQYETHACVFLNVSYTPTGSGLPEFRGQREREVPAGGLYGSIP